MQPIVVNGMYDFDQIHKSPQVNSLDDATYIIMGEQHHRLFVQKEDAEVIEKYVTPGSVLLVECVTSQAELEGQALEDVMSMLHISKRAQSMLTVKGWDRLNHLAGSKADAQKMCVKAGSNAPLNDWKLGHQTVGKVVDAEERLAQLEGSNVDIQAQIHELEEMKKKPGISDERIKDIEWRIKQLEDKLEDNRIKTNKHTARMSEALAGTFEARTEAMVETLDAVEQERQAGKIPGKVFLIAGRAHVKQEDPDRRFSVDSFTKKVDELPAIVIASDRINRPRSALEVLAERAEAQG